MEAFARFAWGLSLAAASLVACGTTAPGPSDNVGKAPAAGTGTTICIPGQSIVCGGPAGCAGYQVCDDTGGRYGDCICEPDASTQADPTLALAVACNAPDAPFDTAPFENVPQMIAGKWWLCSGAAELANVEFTADEHYYLLTYVNGAFVRNLGGQTSGTYSVPQNYQQGQSAGAQFSMNVLATAGRDFSPSYPLVGMIQQTPPGKLSLGGGKYVRIP